jgi:hypothetical protein
MSRQYFEDLLTDPPLANLTAFTTSATETALWNQQQFSPIHAFDGYRGAGKTYKLIAGGVFSTAATPGTATITPRFGISATPASNILLGASVAQTLPASIPSSPWFMQAVLVVRSVGAPGANSTVMLIGQFQGAGLAGTAASNVSITFGGTAGTVDLSIEQAIAIDWTWSVTGDSITPYFVTMQSVN